MSVERSNFRRVLRAARLESEKAKCPRKDLIRRIAALKPEEIYQGICSRTFDILGVIEEAEKCAQDARYERLERELDRRLEKMKSLTGLAWAKNSERINEIFDEMDEIYPTGNHEPLSEKYRRKAAIKKCEESLA